MDRTPELASVGEALRVTLEGTHQAREVVIAAARRSIQSSAASIRATHRGELDRARALLAEARDHLAGAEEAVVLHPELRSGGPLPDARKEMAEAALTLALVGDEPLPVPADLGVDAGAYLNGLAEAASELRRQVLDQLREGDLGRAEELTAAMDEVYSLLVTIDYPDAVTGGLRRATDALRAVLERTRGDLTTTIVADRLRAAIRSEQERRGTR